MSFAPICPCCRVQWPPLTPACPGCKVPFYYARECGHVVTKQRERRGLCMACWERTHRQPRPRRLCDCGAVLGDRRSQRCRACAPRYRGPQPTRPRFWTTVRDDELDMLWRVTPLAALAAHFGRTPGAIRGRAQVLGLGRQPDALVSPAPPPGPDGGG